MRKNDVIWGLLMLTGCASPAEQPWGDHSGGAFEASSAGSGEPSGTTASGPAPATTSSVGEGGAGTGGEGGAGTGGEGGAGTGGAGGGGAGGGGAGGGGAGGEGAGGVIGRHKYTTDPGYFDVVLDTERDRVFLSYGGDGRVNVVDLVSGAMTPVTTGWRAEFMHFDPILDQVIVSLPTRDHSAYWWDEDQEGHVAAIDAVTLAAPTPIWIPLDPWQVVSDGTGHVHVAGGSGQWTSVASVDLATGWYSLAGTIRQNTNIELHPSRDRFYGADNGLSPSDIERWDIVGEAAQPAYDSPYHGDYPMCGDLRIHPAGTTIYTRCGHVFLASNTRPSDMTWVADMGLSWDDLVFGPGGDRAYVLSGSAPVLHVYDTVTLEPAATHAMGEPAQRILAGPEYLVLFRNILGGSPHTEIEVIPIDEL
ncbi:hypothetical protein [Sorangium sp. So ce1389]|uniref:hypothetical protein n=1 Tax=Sorangium sp. So ce1389 TaxID=3133336 RepID=UPI003F623DEE